MKKIPNPGSDKAIKLGCKCPVLDNAHGKGAWGSSGKDAIFWQVGDCPVHIIELDFKRRIGPK